MIVRTECESQEEIGLVYAGCITQSYHHGCIVSIVAPPFLFVAVKGQATALRSTRSTDWHVSEVC